MTPASEDGEALSQDTGHSKRSCEFICSFQDCYIVVKVHSCLRKIPKQSLSFKFGSQEIQHTACCSLTTGNDVRTSMDKFFVLPTTLQGPLLRLLQYFAWQVSVRHLHKPPLFPQKSYCTVAARHERHAHWLQVWESSDRFLEIEHSSRSESILQIRKLFFAIFR